MSKVVNKYLFEICDFISENHLYTKDYINGHKGNYPVYSATIGEPFGYIDSYDMHNQKVLAVVNYGCSGCTYIIQDYKFSIGRNICGIVVKKMYKDSILLEYLQVVATPMFLKAVKGEKQKNLNQKLVKNVIIPIPIKEDGTFDLEEQQRLAGIYSEIENQKQKLLNKKSEIQALLVQIDKEEGVNYKEVSLNKIIKHNNGSASYTKTWCQSHRGKYALFSANNFEPIDFIDSYDYDGKYLTYSKNGCAGYITIINGKFSVNGDRCVITINDEYKNMLDILYLKYYLEPLFRKNKKGRLGIYGKNEFTKLNSNMIKELDIQIPIPLDKDSNFDLEKQKEIADKYKQIDEIKQGLIDKIAYLTSINVIPEFAEE